MKITYNSYIAESESGKQITGNRDDVAVGDTIECEFAFDNASGRRTESHMCVVTDVWPNTIDTDDE